MAELAKGTVGDRPWGRTLAALGLRGVTGQLTVTSDGKRYQIAFEEGAVVGAMSPLASDSAVRVAVTGHLVSSSQVADIARRQAANPGRDEIELIAELARLAPEQVTRLRRRVVAQRAARSFALDRGEFVIDDQVTIATAATNALDVRAVVYLGARQFLSEARLNSDLGVLGQWFQIKPDAVGDLGQFGFGEAERPVLTALGTGAGLAELERPDREQRMVRAVVYTLVSCGVCAVDAAPRPVAAKAHSERIPVMRAAPPIKGPPDEIDDSGIDAATIPRASRQPAPRAVDSTKAAELQKLIDDGLAKLDDGVDHFTLLGVAAEASPEAIRTAYFSLARQLHPDRLAASGIQDASKRAQRLFAEVNTAFAVLSDPKKHYEYVDTLRRGGAAAIQAEQTKAEEMARRVLEAEEAFRRGEIALRRDQITVAVTEIERAISLNPEEPDYHAALAWAKFCGAPDKAQVAGATRKSLEHAIAQAPKSVTPRFYLGRVERILNNDQAALAQFQEVIKRSPHHSEAQGEIRALEARARSPEPATDRGGGGLFSRLKR
ncbi:MAG: DnaJ domain-containing protein [Kofleriaceae bacterium]